VLKDLEKQFFGIEPKNFCLPYVPLLSGLAGLHDLKVFFPFLKAFDHIKLL
tara:strand:- start:393 stop:545 length:153 start_codon:yes stop_codon:yes gene_type:complete